jgi:hypothetical protein
LKGKNSLAYYNQTRFRALALVGGLLYFQIKRGGGEEEGEMKDRPLLEAFFISALNQALVNRP